MSKFGRDELQIQMDEKWNSVGLTKHELFGLFVTIVSTDSDVFIATLKGMVALLTKITVYIKFGVLINNTLIKNSKTLPNLLKLQICDFF